MTLLHSTNSYYWNTYFKKLPIDEYKDTSLKRTLTQLEMMQQIAAVNESENKKFIESMVEVLLTYDNIKICPYKNQNCTLENEGVFCTDSKSLTINKLNIAECFYQWDACCNATEDKLLNKYVTYMDLLQSLAKSNGYNNLAEMWISSYGSDNILIEINELWDQIKSLYHEIHFFVWNRLKGIDDSEITDNFIPIHLVGHNGEEWSDLANVTKPYPKRKSYDINEILKAKNYTIEELVNLSDDFYVSMGFNSAKSACELEETTNNKSTGCHTISYDLCNGDAKVRICNISILSITKELGKVQYFKSYKNQSFAFRQSANDALKEAIGSTLGLSMTNPTYLKQIGLLNIFIDTNQFNINYLMNAALRSVVSLPYYLLTEKWRLDVFSNNTTVQDWNRRWWFYRHYLQGINSLENTTNTKYFDATSQYNIITNQLNLNNFLAIILQFQLYKALCIEAGQYQEGVPLHKCNLYGSIAAGKKLKNALSLGSSTEWKDVLYMLTNQTDINASALLEYFEPLRQFLMIENLKDSKRLRSFLETEYNDKAREVYHNESLATYDFYTDLNNKSKEEAHIAAKLATSSFKKENYFKYFQYLKNVKYINKTLERQVKLNSIIGIDILDEAKILEYNKLISNMTKIYSLAKICPYWKQGCKLESEGLSFKPDIENILSTSYNEEELKYIWKAWHKAATPFIKEHYERYVNLSNEAAVLNGFSDAGAYRRSLYDIDLVPDEMDELWKLVEPIYIALHKYAWKKLKKIYEHLHFEDNLLPLHILGNFWGANWIALKNYLRPYPNVAKALNQSDPDTIIKKTYTILEMFEKSNDFYKSLGLDDCSFSYDSENVTITKPAGKAVVCEMMAYDMFNENDFRFQSCADLSFNDFLSIHHTMGRIQHYILYKKQLTTFKRHISPGLTQAIGEAIGLSVLTQEHLHKAKLMKYFINIEETDINNLMEVALYKIAYLPFAYLVDKWRWNVFHGSIPKEKWNSVWWYYRETFQKVTPPVKMLDESDFDPGTLFHVVNDKDYIGYFLSIILQFQIHRGLCTIAGEYDPKDKTKPLHKCNIFNSKAAGDKLRAGLSLGSSKNWKDVLNVITGENKLDVSAILEYFQPLYDELIDENETIDHFLLITSACIIGLLTIVLLYLLINWLKRKQ